MSIAKYDIVVKFVQHYLHLLTFLIYYVRKFLNNQTRERGYTMKKIVVVATVVLAALAALSAPVSAEEEARDSSSVDSNTRLLFHGTNGDGPVSLSGWIIGANLSQDPSKWFAAVGPHLSGKNWWLDLNAGALFVDKKVIFVPEARGSYDGEKYDFFANLQWIDPTGNAVDLNGNFVEGTYLFIQGNRVIVSGVQFGLETENTWKHGTRALSVGPQLIFSLGKMTCTFSYQFVNKGKRHMWVRAAFSF